MAPATDSESQSDAEVEESEESESEESEDEWGPSARELWEAVAVLMRSAHEMGRLEALETVLPQLPVGPQASAIEHALLDTNSLPTTLRAAEKAAIAMARAEELLELV